MCPHVCAISVFTFCLCQAELLAGCAQQQAACRREKGVGCNEVNMSLPILAGVVVVAGLIVVICSTFFSPSWKTVIQSYAQGVADLSNASGRLVPFILLLLPPCVSNTCQGSGCCPLRRPLPSSPLPRQPPLLPLNW